MDDLKLGFRGYEVTCFECDECLKKETATHITYYHKDGFVHGSFNKKALVELSM